MAGQSLDYGSERQRREGLVGRAALRHQLGEPGFAAHHEATPRAFWERVTPGHGLDAQFDDAIARSDCNLASRTQDRVAVESILAGWFEDVRPQCPVPHSRDFAALVRLLRQRKGLPQEEFARELDVTVGTLSSRENGHHRPLKAQRKRMLHWAMKAGIQAPLAPSSPGSGKEQ